MKPQCIGIVGGAGPLAGTLLLERIFSLAIEKYGCFRDADFPQVFMISYPFSEMLYSERDRTKLKQELSQCLNQLRQNGASVLAIACNTLHAFLDENESFSDLVQLPRCLEGMPFANKPLVLCTSTSRQVELFPCVYPDFKTQVEVDTIIDLTLQGAPRAAILKRLEKLLEAQTADTVVLGCTELSLYSANLQSDKLIIDPLEIAANKLLEKFFRRQQ